MKRNFLLCFIATSIISIGLLFQGIVVEASEGGAVQTNGVVSFYEGSGPSSGSTESSEPTPSSTVDPSNSSSSTLPSISGNKPAGGSYPSTGELVKKSLTISGIVIIAIVLFFIWKRKKAQEERGDHS